LLRQSKKVIGFSQVRVHMIKLRAYCTAHEHTSRAPDIRYPVNIRFTIGKNHPASRITRGDD